MNDLLTTAEVATRCRTTASTVRYWRHTGYGPAGFKLGRRVVYRQDEVERWLNEQSSRDLRAAAVLGAGGRV
jgi:predicted DNA-binding transcriptional regulator AlpA